MAHEVVYIYIYIYIYIYGRTGEQVLVVSSITVLHRWFLWYAQKSVQARLNLCGWRKEGPLRQWRWGIHIMDAPVRYDPGWTDEVGKGRNVSMMTTSIIHGRGVRGITFMKPLFSLIPMEFIWCHCIQGASRNGCPLSRGLHRNTGTHRGRYNSNKSIQSW